MKQNAFALLRRAAQYSRPRPNLCKSAPCAIRWSSSGERQWSTPLAKSLAEAITTTGPISVASYMRQCLTSPDGGYYTRQTTDHDQFGAKGDFITSPEISQVFGELVGIWLYAEWLAQGQKEKVQIIEVGPGRGTLMDDVLRTISNFKTFARSIEAIYLVEASPHLRNQQAQRLSTSNDLKTSEIGWSGPCKYIPGRNVTWCEDIRFIPKEETSTPFILAHEFFDALPIHVFQNVSQSHIPASSTIITPTGPITPKHGPQAPKNQWHELLVAPVSSTTSASSKEPRPDFHLTVSKTPTPHSLYLPQTSPRYKALSNTADAVIEISPESLSYVTDFAIRIGGSNPPAPAAAKTPLPSSSQPSSPVRSKPAPEFQKANPSGAALILDYGPSATIPANTLRGIKAHRTVSPFTEPGLVDLSADVDFVALAETAIDASPGVEVHGPVEQAFFLSTMGIQERAERLIRAAKEAAGKKAAAADEAGKQSEEEVAQRVRSAWTRLVDRGPTGMGRIYKAMAIVPHVPEKKAGRRPVGFGGDVVG